MDEINLTPRGRLPDLSSSKPIGQRLVDAGFLTQEQLKRALLLQQEWHSRLGDVILANRWMNAMSFYKTLATQFGLNFVNLLEQSSNESLFEPDRIDDYVHYLAIPWRREDGRLVIAVADPCRDTFEWARASYGPDVLFVGTAKLDIVWTIQRLGDRYLTDRALNELYEQAPEQSARQVITRKQVYGLYGMASIFLLGLGLAPMTTLVIANSLICMLFLVSFGLKFLLTWYGSRRSIDIKVSDVDVAALSDDELPVYTVLVPMYREPDVLPILAGALRKLDYPTAKLDVKLILEADDTETIDTAKRLGLEAIFEIIRVPPSQPKTKPKACNYALSFARGQLTTIYDAEDKPEPDQLKKVFAAFKKLPPEVVCIQARLNYYNAEENWLTRMFSLEYTLWFDFYLPALEYLRIPIPLGGTSNHFRTDVLKEVNAWDPYNVTEDADLGVRLIQRKYRVGVVNSTTYEEANVSIPNWIRQRSRWLKGYMQTYLVHMRAPLHLYRSTGSMGFWGFQFFIGGTVFTALAAPVMWLIYLIWLVARTSAFDAVFPAFLSHLSLFNLLAGNGFFTYLMMIAGSRRDYFRLVPYALSVPFYWVLQSVAAYKGLWQLIHNPFYWEKTTHGISKHVAAERRSALED